MKEVAFGIEGVENDPNPGEGTVRVYWKQFMAGWQREHAAIPGHITISVTNVRIFCDDKNEVYYDDSLELTD